MDDPSLILQFGRIPFTMQTQVLSYQPYSCSPHNLPSQHEAQPEAAVGGMCEHRTHLGIVSAYAFPSNQMERLKSEIGFWVKRFIRSYVIRSSLCSTSGFFNFRGEYRKTYILVRRKEIRLESECRKVLNTSWPEVDFITTATSKVNRNKQSELEVHTLTNLKFFIYKPFIRCWLNISSSANVI